MSNGVPKWADDLADEWEARAARSRAKTRAEFPASTHIAVQLEQAVCACARELRERAARGSA